MASKKAWEAYIELHSDSSKLEWEIKTKLKKTWEDWGKTLNEWIKKWIDKSKSSVDSLSSKFSSLWNKIKEVFSTNSITSFAAKIPLIWAWLQAWITAFNALRDVIRKVWDTIKQTMDTARSFEDAFAWVRKTVDDTESNLQKLEKWLINLSTQIPITTEELAWIAEMWGQLWIPTSQLLKFTDVVAKLGVSTNMTTDQIATSFARIANITQEPMENIDRMGAVVVWLGNNFATTESEIVNFATRIAGAWEIAWLTTSQIFWISTAFSSVGIEAEAWGTAVQKVLLDINNAVSNGSSRLNAYAVIAWKTADEFKKAWKDNAWQAFTDFVKWLSNSWDEANQILSEMWLNDVRLQRAFLSLANAWDLLQETIDLSNQSWEQNNALQEEANKRFQTTSSQLQISNNKWRAFGASIWEVFNKIRVPVYRTITDFFTDVLPWLFQQWYNIFYNFETIIGNVSKNIIAAFTKIPTGITSPINKVIWFIESMVNWALNSINWMLDYVKKIPWVASLLWDVKLWTVSLNRVDWSWIKWMDFVDILSWTRSLESLSERATKSYDIAAWKVKNRIQADLDTETSMLEQVLDSLDDKTSSSSGKRKAQSEDEKKAVKEAQDAYSDLSSELSEHNKALEKAQQELDKVNEKYQDLKDSAMDAFHEAANSIKELDVKLWENEEDKIKRLWERYQELQEKIKEALYNKDMKWIDENYSKEMLQNWLEDWDTEINGVKIKEVLELKELKEEVKQIEEATTEEQRKSLEFTEKLSKTQEILNAAQEKAKELEQQKAEAIEKQNIAKAFQWQWDWNIKVFTDTVAWELKGWYEDETWKMVEITNFKNIQYAQDLYNKSQELEQQKTQLEDQIEREKLKHDGLIKDLSDMDKRYTKLMSDEIDKQKIKIDELITYYNRLAAAKASASSWWWLAVWWPAQAWTPYLIWENYKPELFVPSTSWSVVPVNNYDQSKSVSISWVTINANNPEEFWSQIQEQIWDYT